MKLTTLLTAAVLAFTATMPCFAQHHHCGKGCSENAPAQKSQEPPKVYFIKEITPESLIRIYKALGLPADGKVAVKISTGEKGNPNYLKPELIGDFVKLVDGTIVECNTAYKGKRYYNNDHREVIKEHGFPSIAPVIIMDSVADVKIPVGPKAKHLKYDLVGEAFNDYDFLICLSHFKGHQMGGFGGAIKNLSIGVASRNGKAYIHSAGKVDDAEILWDHIAQQDDFQESMAEAAQAVVDHMKGRAVYINVANNLSVDCDCNGNPEPVCMADIGIFASLDPVALDKATVDAVRNSKDHGRDHMIERIDSRHGMVSLKHAEEIGLGSQEYELIELK